MIWWILITPFEKSGVFLLNTLIKRLSNLGLRWFKINIGSIIYGVGRYSSRKSRRTVGLLVAVSRMQCESRDRWCFSVYGPFEACKPGDYRLRAVPRQYTSKHAGRRAFPSPTPDNQEPFFYPSIPFASNTRTVSPSRILVSPLGTINSLSSLKTRTMRNSWSKWIFLIFLFTQLL